MSVTTLLATVHSCPRITALTFNRDLGDDTAITSLTRDPFLERVRSLSFDGPCTVSSRSLLSIIGACLALEGLSLYLSSYDAAALEELAALRPSLTELDLHDPDRNGLTDATLETAFLAFPCLRSLSITQCEDLTNDALYLIARSPFRTKLVEIDLSWNSFELEAVEAVLDACPNLIKLTFHGYDCGPAYEDDEGRAYEKHWEDMYEVLEARMAGRGGSFNGCLQ